MDQAVEHFAIQIASKRWYMKIFFFLFSITLNNMWQIALSHISSELANY